MNVREARDLLLDHATDYDTAYAQFAWPRPEHFNFAIDWFDGVLAAEHPNRAALRLIEADGTDNSYTYAELSARSDQLAAWLMAAYMLCINIPNGALSSVRTFVSAYLYSARTYCQRRPFTVVSPLLF